MQSLTRYHLLLDNIVKRTPQEHPDIALLVCVYVYVYFVHGNTTLCVIEYKMHCVAMYAYLAYVAHGSITVYIWYIPCAWKHYIEHIY